MTGRWEYPCSEENHERINTCTYACHFVQLCKDRLLRFYTRTQGFVTAHFTQPQPNIWLEHTSMVCTLNNYISIIYLAPFVVLHEYFKVTFPPSPPPCASLWSVYVRLHRSYVVTLNRMIPKPARFVLDPIFVTFGVFLLRERLVSKTVSS